VYLCRRSKVGPEVATRASQGPHRGMPAIQSKERNGKIITIIKKCSVCFFL